MLDKLETVAGLRDPASPGAATANCTGGLVCDTTTGTCVSPTDGGVGDTSVGDGSSDGGGDGATSDGATDGSGGDGGKVDGGGDGSGGDGSGGDGSGGDGSGGDGSGGDGSGGDGSGGDGTVVTDGSSDGTLTDGSGGDTAASDGGVDTDPSVDTGIGATDNDILDTGANPATTEDSVLEGGGCSCTTTGGASNTSLGMLALVGLALAAGRRRKR